MPWNQTAPWHWNIKEQTSPFCSRRVIPKSKGFNLDDYTKNKKYHHQEDCYHETTQKIKKRLQTFKYIRSTTIGNLYNRKEAYKERVKFLYRYIII